MEAGKDMDISRYWRDKSEGEILQQLRNISLPDICVPLSDERRPFATLSDDAVLGYLEFFRQYPEALGRLSLAVKKAFGIDLPCPREFVIKESHFDLTSLEPDLLDKLVPLGFEPDHFATLNPPEYKWCLTMKMEVPTSGADSASRLRQIHQMVMRNSFLARDLVERYQSIFGYLEVETYSSQSRHVFPFREVSGEGLEMFPFEAGEFEQVRPPSTTKEAAETGLPLDVHKLIDIHVKIPTEVRGAEFRGAGGARTAALREKFLEAGFYEIYSEAGNHIYTIQLLDAKSSKPVYQRLRLWAEQFGGIVGMKMESCNYFYRTPRQINGEMNLAPIPNLVTWAKAPTPKMERDRMTAVEQFDPRAILDFLHVSARLKSELRHCTDGSGERKESVAEHCFQMTLLALTVHRYLEHRVDLTRLIKLCICHDLVEAIAGDVPYVEGADKSEKVKREQEAMDLLVAMLPGDLGLEIKELWYEFEECVTMEAKCAKALDNLEAQLQHNIAPLNTWEEREFPMVFTKMDKWCVHDSTLKALCEAIKDDACGKMEAEGISPDLYRP